MVFGVTNEPLHKHWIFWACVFSPPAIAVVLMCFFGFFSLEISKTPEGVAYFYDEAKLIIFVATLAIPFGATFSRIHSSHQSAESINQALEVSKREAKQSLKTDFFSMLDMYEGYEIKLGDDVAVFRRDVLKAPLVTYNSIFLPSDECKPEEITVIQKAKELVTIFEDFCLISDGEGFVDFCNKRAAKLVLLSMSAEFLAKRCGVDNHFTPARAAYEGNVVKSYFVCRDIGNPDGLPSQSEGVSNLSKNLSGIGLAFYYSSHISSGRSEVLSETLSLIAGYFLACGASLSAGVAELGTCDVNEKFDGGFELTPSDRGMLAFWGGRFLGVENSFHSSYRAKIVGEMKMDGRDS